jgi:hypothetical protein
VASDIYYDGHLSRKNERRLRHAGLLADASWGCRRISSGVRQWNRRRIVIWPRGRRGQVRRGAGSLLPDPVSGQAPTITIR